MTTTDDWGRLARAVAERRAELGKSQVELAQDSGMSLDTVQAIEAARRTGYRAKTLRGLERGLGWPARAVDRILAGDDPGRAPAAEVPAPTTAQLQQELARRLAALSEQIAALDDRNADTAAAIITGLEKVVERSTNDAGQ